VKTTTTLITDDLDGTPDAHPVTFTVDGHSYEIDLADPNIQRLHNALAPFIEAGRRTRNHKPTLTRRRPDPATDRRRRITDVDVPATDIRHWWQQHPDTLPTWQAKGAIPYAVQRAYQQACG